MDDIRTLLDGQLNTAWALLDLHLTDLTDEECLWRPAQLNLELMKNASEIGYCRFLYASRAL